MIEALNELMTNIVYNRSRNCHSKEGKKDECTSSSRQTNLIYSWANVVFHATIKSSPSEELV